MGEQTYRYRGHWVPSVMAGAAVVAVALWYLALKGPMSSVDPLFESLPVGAGFVLLAAICLARHERREFRVTPAGFELRRPLALRRRWTWSQVEWVRVDADAARISTTTGDLRIGPEVERWQELVQELQARVPPAPEGAELSDSELTTWLGGGPSWLIVWRPCSETLWPILLAGLAAGAVVALLAAAREWVHGETWPALWSLAAVFGAGAGGVYALPPALAAALPLVLKVTPSGLRLYGLTRWGAHRDWRQVQALRTGWRTCRLVTECESLCFWRAPAPHQHLARAVEKLLAARRHGRLTAPADAIPRGALSRASHDAPEAARGLSAPG